MLIFHFSIVVVLVTVIVIGVVIGHIILCTTRHTDIYSFKGIVQPQMKFKSLSPPPMLMKSRSPQNLSGDLQLNSIAAFSSSEVGGDLI